MISNAVKVGALLQCLAPIFMTVFIN